MDRILLPTAQLRRRRADALRPLWRVRHSRNA
jgi:hypothetical protein